MFTSPTTSAAAVVGHFSSNTSVSFSWRTEVFADWQTVHLLVSFLSSVV